MRLTEDIRHNIINAVLDHRFKADEETAEAAIQRTSMLLYNRLFPTVDYSRVPDAFLRFDNEMEVYWKQQTYQDKLELRLTDMMLVPHNGVFSVCVSGIPEGVALRRAHDARDKIEKERNALRFKLRQILKPMHTTAQLKKSWPDIAAFVPSEPPPVKQKALTVVPKQLSKELRLPPS
jgi:hypothetical protein